MKLLYWSFYYRVRTLLSSSNYMTFHGFFKFSKTLNLAVSFKNSTPLLVLEQKQKFWSSSKCVPFTLLNYSPPSYIVLALSTAVNNLSNKTLFSMTSKDRQLNSRTFQAWKWNWQIPWLSRFSRFSMTCTNPVLSWNDNPLHFQHIHQLLIYLKLDLYSLLTIQTVTRFLAVHLKIHVWSHQRALKAKVQCDFSNAYSADHTNVLWLMNIKT